jgi:hypothetical protein
MPAYSNVNRGNMMKNVKLKLAVLGAFSILSVQAMATGLVPLPAAGFVVAAGANQPAGTTGYTRCNTTGNYGSTISTAPTAGANNTCAVFPANANTSPVAGFTLKQSVTTVLTGNGGETLTTMQERMFRNAANTSCIYGKYFSMATTTTFDYNPLRAGNNPIELNDIALGGFDTVPPTANTVNAGYYFPTGAGSVIYRMGRNYTSVQTQAATAGSASLGANYVHQPITTSAPASNTEINGTGIQSPFPFAVAQTPTPAQQAALIHTNWVDFTMDVTGAADEDGTTLPFSPWLYVQADCTSTAAANLANSVVLRQTGQESQPWIVIKKAGLARSGANALPN